MKSRHNTSVKAIGNGKIGGYLVVFGDADTKDLQGEYFTAKTEFNLDWYEVRPALYHHGLDGSIEAAPIGKIDTIKQDSIGLWAEAQIDMNREYGEAVQKLVDKGVLHWSSGSLAHLVETKSDGQIKKWPRTSIAKSVPNSKAGPQAQKPSWAGSSDVVIPSPRIPASCEV